MLIATFKRIKKHNKNEKKEGAQSFNKNNTFVPVCSFLLNNNNVRNIIIIILISKQNTFL